MAEECNLRLLRPAEVARKTGYHRSTLYRLEREGKFPRRRVLPGGGASGWMEHEVNNWLAAL